jgi:predicted DNA-binding transcriptional regulator AlpA
MPETHVFLTEDQAAAFLCVSLSTLRRWRRNGTGPKYFRLGNIIRYGKAEVLRFIAEHSGDVNLPVSNAA